MASVEMWTGGSLTRCWSGSLEDAPIDRYALLGENVAVLLFQSECQLWYYTIQP